MKGLIASDIDGTLMPEDSPALPREVFDEILRLIADGWHFSAASGRQYNSLRKLFAPVEKQMSFICANGAVVFGGDGRAMDKTVLPRAQALELAHDIYAVPNCEVLISGEDMNYVIPKTDFLLHLMRDIKGHNVTVLSSPEETPEEIIKVSAYVFDGAAAFPAALVEKWAAYHPAVAGKCWVDFTLADKGTGLAQLCRILGIEPADAYVFGDNFNDEPMLSLAGHPYIMSTAAPDLLSKFPNHCDNVLEVLRAL